MHDPIESNEASCEALIDDPLAAWFYAVILALHIALLYILYLWASNPTAA